MRFFPAGGMKFGGEAPSISGLPPAETPEKCLDKLRFVPGFFYNPIPEGLKMRGTPNARCRTSPPCIQRPGSPAEKPVVRYDMKTATHQTNCFNGSTERAHLI